MTLINKHLTNLTLFLATLFLGSGAMETLAQPASTALTIRADVQEANSRTGVITAKGNVRMNYPARNINATSAQAQYFSKERRIVLSGNVVVIQQGNRIKAETITYLVDEGKFEALPEANRQVESVYVVPDDGVATTAATSATPVTQIKPAFKGLVSPPTPTTDPKAKPAASKQPQQSESENQPASNPQNPKSKAYFVKGEAFPDPKLR